MEKGKGVFYSDPHVHGLNLLADVVENAAKSLLASKILTASDLERHLNRLFLPKNQVTENVAKILSAEEWDGVNYHKKEIVVRTWVGGIEEIPSISNIGILAEPTSSAARTGSIWHRNMVVRTWVGGIEEIPSISNIGILAEPTSSAARTGSIWHRNMPCKLETN
ncbi:hypothetical protein AMTR_s03854p00003440 [Amborella trichopoda]|uniref:Uncharacterized protein n=1 Tax=Amborella trichopoda TaxID=13333 RepID=U5CVL1_AMBTC|nr:hypothetical protein AMTR_s03854p00003440 [Amborella trichopoda]